MKRKVEANNSNVRLCIHIFKKYIFRWQLFIESDRVNTVLGSSRKAYRPQALRDSSTIPFKSFFLLYPWLFMAFTT